jgi:hypothetical protein
MNKLSFLVSLFVLVSNYAIAQNVGVGTHTPSEKLHVDSGHIKIGKLTWTSNAQSSFLKFGDGNFITLGEEEADDNLTIRAKEILIRPSPSYTNVPVTIQGSTNFSHFYFGSNEDTYIRGGKSSSNVVIGDGGGRTGINVYPQRAMFEQNGVVGNTAAIFGGDGSGVSLQRNWPAVGFNQYYDGSTHRSIGQGYSGQLGINQVNGSLYLASWPFASVPNANLGSFTQRFYVSRFGKIGLGTDDPQLDVHIVQSGNVFEGGGIRLDYTDPQFNNYSGWNIATQTGTFLSSGNDFYGNPLFFKSLTGPGGLGGIGNDGNYYQNSDLNLKKNIHYLAKDHLMDKIMDLKPSTYLFKPDPENQPPRYGFIAQDVENLFPEFVLNTGTGIKLVSYSSFVPILTKGMQEQQQQINTLQKENADLKARLEKIEHLIAHQ